MNSLDSAVELLQAAYQQLAFDQGKLLSAVRQPEAGAAGDWLDKGDWQTLAAQLARTRSSSSIAILLWCSQSPTIAPPKS